MVDMDRFKEGMRHLGGSVAVVTTGSGNRLGGLTATAVSSLAADPPSLLACVNKSASAHDLFQEMGNICVNILAADQAEIANLFANSKLVNERFEHCDWTQGATGAPIITGAVASFDCRLEATHNAFTHSIMIGVVQETYANDGLSLLYENAAYGKFGALD